MEKPFIRKNNVRPICELVGEANKVNLRKPVNKDEVTIGRINKLHPLLRKEAMEIYMRICGLLTGKAICRFAFTYRSFAEQQALYSQGRTAPGKKVTNAKAGSSYHNYGLAIDIVLLKDVNGDGSFETASWETDYDFDGDGEADWMEIVHLFKQYGWEWGGDWKFTDLPHFQKTYGYSVRELYTLFSTGKTDKEKYVTINPKK